MPHFQRGKLWGAAAVFLAAATCYADAVSEQLDLSALQERSRHSADYLAVGNPLGALRALRYDSAGPSVKLSGLAVEWNRQLQVEVLAAMGSYDEAQALQRRGEPVNPAPFPPADEERAASRAVHLEDAQALILEAVRSHRVVMLNEEHWRPEHRAFGASMIPALRRAGVKYLALETRDQGPLDAAMRSGIVRTTTDPYCYEPQRAGLLRAAIQAGMSVIAFDVSDPAELAELRKDPVAGIARREDWMARNVQERILRAHPEARVLVWVGMGHIAKKPMMVGGKQVEFFALRLWKRTGTEPFCINQVSDSGDVAKDRSAYRLLAKTGTHQIRRPVAFRNDEQHIPAAQPGSDPIYGLGREVGLDAMVIHPPAPFEHGAQRPLWLRRLKRRRVAVRLGKLLPDFDPEARYLLQAIPRNGGDDTAPDDQVVANAKGVGVLYVAPGLDHTLRVWRAAPRSREECMILVRKL